MVNRRKAEIDEILSRVVGYIPTKNGRIGIVIPPNKPTQEEWKELHRIVAEILISSAIMKRSASKDESMK